MAATITDLRISARYRLIFSALLLSALIFLPYIRTEAAATQNGPVKVKKEDKCPVCGMFVEKYRNWTAQIIFRDGTYAVFDGPKDMFKYYLNPAKYNPSKSQSDISAVYVTEYYSVNFMDARRMYYVHGSDVRGPMGAELIPLASENQAKEFLKDHGGTRILRFHDIDIDVVNKL
jgi:nitrous oxide reductase accessory protein NosL